MLVSQVAMARARGGHGSRLLMPAGAVSTWETASVSPGLQRFSRMERVTGIEPALSAWETHVYVRVVFRGLCVTWSPMTCIGPRLLHADCTLSSRCTVNARVSGLVLAQLLERRADELQILHAMGTVRVITLRRVRAEGLGVMRTMAAQIPPSSPALVSPISESRGRSEPSTSWLQTRGSGGV